MNLEAVGKRLVRLCNEGKGEEAVAELYASNIVSIEPRGTPEMPARIQGMDAVRNKGEWWFANHEVHALSAEGPFIGNREEVFAVKFTMDFTPKGGTRTPMTEIGIYTVKDGKIVQEEFLYSA